MATTVALPGRTASTYLTHFSCNRLADSTYVVEHFRTLLNGDIRRSPDVPTAAKKGRNRTNCATTALKAM